MKAPLGPPSPLEVVKVVTKPIFSVSDQAFWEAFGLHFGTFFVCFLQFDFSMIFSRFWGRFGGPSQPQKLVFC